MVVGAIGLATTLLLFGDGRPGARTVVQTDVVHRDVVHRDVVVDDVEVVECPSRWSVAPARRRVTRGGASTLRSPEGAARGEGSEAGSPRVGPCRTTLAPLRSRRESRRTACGHRPGGVVGDTGSWPIAGSAPMGPWTDAELTRLLQAERDARAAAERSARRLADLQAITAGLSQARTPDQVAEVIVEGATSGAGAASGALCLLTDDGRTMEIVRSVGYDPAAIERFRTFPLESDLPASDAIRTRRIVLMGSLGGARRALPGAEGRSRPQPGLRRRARLRRRPSHGRARPGLGRDAGPSPTTTPASSTPSASRRDRPSTGPATTPPSTRRPSARVSWPRPAGC